ncbi:hypothetical protein ABXV22_07075 [Vibrio rotiferianus]|uniref:hypothetical protein n=1 Tax=Vibrio rotiferianus TaxID=190895 RepID=UPI0033931E41
MQYGIIEDITTVGITFGGTTYNPDTKTKLMMTINLLAKHLRISVHDANRIYHQMAEAAYNQAEYEMNTITELMDMEIVECKI